MSRDTSHLEGNDFAKGNPGGGAPKGNTNARVHGAWGDWEIAYDRFEGETKEYVDRLVESIQERAAEHAPDVDEEKRAELAKEHATLGVLKRLAEKDVWGFITDSDTGRGVLVEEEREDLERNVEKLNPATKAVRRIVKRRRKIAEELCLRKQFQREDEGEDTDEDE
jgi:hypothetical protein